MKRVLVISVSGGVVQSVCSNLPSDAASDSCEIIVQDWDDIAADGDEPELPDGATDYQLV